jgi:hypothetical protein
MIFLKFWTFGKLDDIGVEQRVRDHKREDGSGGWMVFVLYRGSCVSG